MKDFTLPRLPVLEDEPHRSFLTRAIAYGFILFCLLPLLTGIGLPFWLGLTDQPLVDLPVRLTLLVATGGVTFLLLLLPLLFFLNSRLARGGYVFLLLPVSATCQAAQFIMYREFGTEIGERAKGLFQGNISALWAFACSEYHLQWVIPGVLVFSLVCTLWVCRPSRCRWNPSVKAFGGAGLALLATGALALGFNPRLERIEHYHPTKISSAPLFQVLSFVNKFYLQGEGSSYADILEMTGPMAEESERAEIEKRLGEDPDAFVHRTASPPAWLKKRPSHVFLFLMESYGFGVIEDPAYAEITPCLRRFAEEGISVPNFSSANNQTITSVHAMASGVAPLPSYPAPRSLSYFAPDTLPRVMSRAGYQPSFYAASYRHFGSKGDSCEGWGYEKFIGCPDVATHIRSNEWGVCDGDFFEWCQAELGDLSRSCFVSFLNVSNHSPYDAPKAELERGGLVSPVALEKFVGRDEAEKLKYALHARYADAQIGEMVDYLKAKCPDALFVFVGDHGAAKMQSDPVLRVPFVLWNDEVIDSGVAASGWFGGHMDMLATLAPLVLPEGEIFETMGSPVWERSPERVTSAGDFILATEGYFNRTGQIVRPLPGPVEPTAGSWDGKRKVLKASAIDALSWGYVNLRKLEE